MAWRPRAWRFSCRRRRIRAGARQRPRQDAPEQASTTTMRCRAQTRTPEAWFARAKRPRSGRHHRADRQPRPRRRLPARSARREIRTWYPIDHGASYWQAGLANDPSPRRRIAGKRRTPRRAHRPCRARPCAGSGRPGQRLQLAPRLDEIVTQGRGRDPRDDGAAIIADAVGALDADELCRAGLQALDDAGAGGGSSPAGGDSFGTMSRNSRFSATGSDAGGGEGLERLQHLGLAASDSRRRELRFIGIVMANATSSRVAATTWRTACRPSPWRRRSFRPAVRARRAAVVLARSSWEMRSSRAARSGRGRRIARRRFRIVRCAGGLVGLRAQIGDVAAQGCRRIFPVHRAARRWPDRRRACPLWLRLRRHVR